MTIYAVLSAICFTFAVAFLLGFWLSAKLVGQRIAERLNKAQAVELLRHLKKETKP